MVQLALPSESPAGAPCSNYPVQKETSQEAQDDGSYFCSVMQLLDGLLPPLVPEIFKCCSTRSAGRSNIEFGNKILLPDCVLMEAHSRGLDGASGNPMLFELKNPSQPGQQKLNCGVLEFVAPEDTCVLP